ncbi:putative bifunctional diguanylate cyclase/phosphodiesterase [Rhabdochromatium marinum]|uniref:putative bifunctional diguanylate cyclase/phosphodiesterase n=1 Tax=Rhabdochromatium marinum TaxID=48729 RepID=UPI00190429CD|nr:GGDEF domain-containing phosphodiesterase [Rhabdochromatium marinum]MBK1648314.1 hypothetical protein [Rhabdochromatium marinum]
MPADTTPEALAYYRQQCDELGARVMQLQEALVQARRDARRDRTLALVVQRIYAFAQTLQDSPEFADQLGEQLLMLFIERLAIDAAALLQRTDTPEPCRFKLTQAIGIKTASSIPVLTEFPANGSLLPGNHPILQATNLEQGFWVELHNSPLSLLLGLRNKPRGQRKQLNPADRQIAEAALSVYSGLLERQRDFSARQQTEKDLRRIQERLDLALEGADVGLYDMNLETGHVACDERFARILGCDPDTTPTSMEEWCQRLHPEDLPNVQHITSAVLDGQRHKIELQYRIRHQSGAWIWLLDRAKGFDPDPSGRPRRAAGSCLNITEQKLSEAAIHRLAYFDPLTDLPNRRLFLDRLTTAQAAAQRHGHIGAVMFLDIDRFKQINDARGHNVGDHLLQKLAARLHSTLRAEDTIARFGGDEFVILLTKLSRDAVEASHYARVVAEKIHRLLSVPFELPEGEINSEISIGITLLRGNEVCFHDLLREADTALYDAKESGRNCTRFFEKSMQQAAEARFNLEGELKHAIDDHQLMLYYQPQVDAQGHLLGMEALLRWRHPSKGMIPPKIFISVAEDTSLILPIGHWVLNEACRFLAQIKRHNRALSLSVNVSPRQFLQTHFVAQVQQALDQSGIPSECLTLELTEGVVIEDIQGTVEKMQDLKALGVRLSIDDFGTGYSSLAYLKQLPIDELKIDRSFIQDVCTDSNDVALVEAILAVCRHLKVAVVAEGVETEEQLQFLRTRHCDLYQGYFFSMPLPTDEFMQTFDLHSTPM